MHEAKNDKSHPPAVMLCNVLLQQTSIVLCAEKYTRYLQILQGFHATDLISASQDTINKLLWQQHKNLKQHCCCRISNSTKEPDRSIIPAKQSKKLSMHH